MLFDDPGAISEVGERVLMLAPTPRDAAMARSILAESGFKSEVFEIYEDLARALEEGAGAVILMEEFFASKDAAGLLELLGRQPAWSSLALIVLSAGRDRLSTGAVVPSQVVRERSARRAARPHRAAGQRHQGGPRRPAEAVRDPRLYPGDQAVGPGAGPALPGRRGRQPHEGRVPRHPLHELRTPLNAILGWAEILRTGKVDAEDLEEGLAAIERNAQAQAQIIEDLLDISRIISGNLRLDVQRVNIAEVIEAAIAAVMPAAEAKGIRLHKVLDPLGRPRLGRPGPAPAGRLEPPDQRREVHAQGRPGPGAPGAGQLARRDHRHRHRHGHPARVPAARLRPIPPGRLLDDAPPRRAGARPGHRQAARRAARRHGAGQEPRRGPGLHVRGEPAHHGRAPSSRRGEDPAEGPQPGRVRLLRTGRSRASRCSWWTTSRTPGNSSAGSRRSAGRRWPSPNRRPRPWSSSSRFRPDILVSDIGMPDQDGYDLIRQVRGRVAAKTLPAVALTAFARSEDRRRALLAGFQTHVAKPVDPAELVAVVASLVERTGTA